MEVILNALVNVSKNIFKYLLKCGPIPRHMAIIIDGSRRYAKEKGLKPELAHKLGENTVLKVFNWCHDLGIREVTIYTFSVDNFMRSEQEVNNLMKIIGKVLQGFLDDRARGDGERAVRIFGNLTMLDKWLQKLVAQLELTNPEIPVFTINLCIAYNSTEEFKHAFQELQDCVKIGLISESDITQTLFTKFLFTRESTEPDILLRTSGEHRLSDFLLWQSSHSVIYFNEVLWPEFSLWHLLLAVLHYQRNYLPALKAKIEQDRHRKQINSGLLEEKDKVERCLSYLVTKRTDLLRDILRD